MILTVFNAGWGKASNATRYLFSEKDANGNVRNPPAELYKGDRELTEKLIDLCPNKNFKYTSGAIAFRNNEKPTNEQIDEVIKSFRDFFCPGMNEDRVNMLWVRHEDKGNTELHFLLVMQDNLTMKQYSISPAKRGKDGSYNKCKHSMQHEKDFASYWNDKLGYEQVKEDPFKASFSQFDTKTSDGSKNKARKERLSYEISKRVKGGTINNRNDLIAFLNKKDFKVTRAGKDYLSIVMPGKTKAIRFNGGCFAENANYQEMVKASENTRKKLTQDERNVIIKRINSSVQYRADFNKKRYIFKKRIPNFDKKPVNSKPKAKPIKVNSEPQVQQKQSIQPDTNNIQKSQNMKNSNASGSSPSTVSGGNSLERLMANIGSLENRILALGIKLSQVPTEQRAQIEKQLAELKVQLMRLQQQLGEAKKAELNKDSPSKPKFR